MKEKTLKYVELLGDLLRTFLLSQEQVVNIVSEGAANAKDAAHSAADAINENAHTLKDKACKLKCMMSIKFELYY